MLPFKVYVGKDNAFPLKKQIFHKKSAKKVVICYP